MKKLLLLLTSLFALVASAQDPVVTVTPSTTNMGKINAYNSSFTLTGDNGQTWKVAGFNNNNLGWASDPMRCGWKTNATSATITTNFAITEAVDKITFDVWRRNAGTNDKLTAIKVLVSADATFTSATEYTGDISEIPSSANGRGTVTVNITAPVANQYYRIQLETAKASNNGWLGVNTISYYGQQAADAIAAPIITLEENNMVSITHEDDADIYYTTDGEIPTTGSTQYSAPFEISDVTTVKAIAVLDGKESAVTTKEIKPNVVTSIGKFLELANNVDDTKINAPLTAIYQCGRNLYLTDGTDYILAYNSANITDITNLEAENGDVISFITGAYKSQNGLPEIIPSAVGEKTSGTPVEPNEYAIEEISTSMLNEYVRIVDVNIVAASSANNYTATDENGSSIVIYNSFYNATYYPNAIILPDGSYSNTVPEGEGFAVYGFVSCYNSTLQITPIKFEGGTVMEAVATPTFSPASGSELAVGDLITIECATENATIYYTLDGEDPTTGSTAYTEPFAFTEACTVKAIAVKDGYIDSDIATASYSLYIEGSNTATFDFTASGNVAALANKTIATPVATATSTPIDGVSFTNGPIVLNTLTANHSNGNSPTWFYYTNNSATECRVYKANEFNVYLAQDGYRITKIEFTQNEGSTNWGDVTVTTNEEDVTGTVATTNKAWEAPAGSLINKVTFTPTATIRFATLKVTYVEDSNGVAEIGSIGIDNSNAPVEYFNLQGIRVNGDQLTPGLYIRRQGTEASKVLVK